MTIDRSPAMDRSASYGLHSRVSLLRGMDLVADLIQPTLGPLGGVILVSGDSRNRAGSALSDAGQIARRAVQFSTESDDMGAMLLRNLAWRMSTDAGGGAATAVVMARALFRQLVRGIEAGFNPWDMSNTIGLLALESEQRIAASAQKTTSLRTLTAALGQSLPEPGAAEAIAEVLDTLGANAVIRTKTGQHADISCSYQEGSFWTLRCASRYLLPNDASEITLADAAILVTDIPLGSPDQLAPILDQMVASQRRAVVLIAPEMSDKVISMLTINQERGVLDRAFAVLAPTTSSTRRELLEDIATISGARLLSSDRGDALRKATPDDLGAARLAWGTATTFGLRGGAGTAAQRLEVIARLQTEILDATPSRKKQLDKRIGNLAGAVAELRLPAGPDATNAELEQRAESAIASGRLILQDGLVAGGGMALYTAGAENRSISEHLRNFCERAMRQALSAPLKAIVSNAGYSPEKIVVEMADHPGQIFDVRAGRWTDPWQAGVVDSVAVCCAALRESVKTALQAISIEALVPRKNPPFSELP